MSLIIMILLLSLLILVHEAGHFFTAKLFGMKVERFGFGLPVGPVLWEKKVGDTIVCVHAFLLGGYVSFPDDDENCDLPADSEDRFINRPYYQKAAVVSAGVVANVLCAIVLVVITAIFWGHLPSGNYDVFAKKIVAPKDYSVWNSGLMEGDQFYEINGQKINNAYSFITYIKMSKAYDGKTTEKIINDTYNALKELNPAFEKDEVIPKGINIRFPEVKYEDSIVLDKYESKGAKYPEDTQIKLSEKALKLRNELIKENKNYYESNGEYSLYGVAQALSDNYHPINITVIRNGKEVKLNPIYINEKGALGVELNIKEINIDTKTPLKIIKTSVKYLIDNTYLMLYGLGQIFTGKVPLSDLHGVIAITKIGGDEIAYGGIFPGLLLTALISMNLALINILPIPALDGGHLLFMTIEKITGRKLNEDVINKVASTFFFLLIALMIYIIFNDIYALIVHKF